MQAASKNLVLPVSLATIGLVLAATVWVVAPWGADDRGTGSYRPGDVPGAVADDPDATQIPVATEHEVPSASVDSSGVPSPEEARTVLPVGGDPGRAAEPVPMVQEQPASKTTSPEQPLKISQRREPPSPTSRGQEPPRDVPPARESRASGASLTSFGAGGQAAPSPEISPVRATSETTRSRSLDDPDRASSAAPAAAAPSTPADGPGTGAETTARVGMLAPRQVVVGQRLSVTIIIESGTDVGHAPFHVTFDPTVLRFEFGEEGPFLGQDGVPTAFFAAPTGGGDTVVVGLSRLGQVPGVDGSGELCVLHFDVIGPGHAALGFARAKLRDSTNRIRPARFETVAVAAL